jgi:hypothetical protein
MSLMPAQQDATLAAVTALAWLGDGVAGRADEGEGPVRAEPLGKQCDGAAAGGGSAAEEVPPRLQERLRAMIGNMRQVLQQAPDARACPAW